MALEGLFLEKKHFRGQRYGLSAKGEIAVGTNIFPMVHKRVPYGTKTFLFVQKMPFGIIFSLFRFRKSPFLRTFATENEHDR